MNTYAVIETGGKQYRVEKGTSLLVDRLSAKEGDKISLRPVMFRDKDVVAEPKELEKVRVEATVAEHLRGSKIKVFKYKPKKGYRRRAGHRSELTRLEVTELKLLTRKAAPKAEPKEKPAEGKSAEKKPAARQKAKKQVAKKPGAKKQPDRKGSDGS
jgi:large subunit ribosomal protein L21